MQKLHPDGEGPQTTGFEGSLGAYTLGVYTLGVYTLRVYALGPADLDLDQHLPVRKKHYRGPLNADVV